MLWKSEGVETIPITGFLATLQAVCKKNKLEIAIRGEKSKVSAQANSC